MAEILMYSTAWCPYCVRARRLLDTKGVTYTDIRLDEFPERRAEMEERAHGRTSVPQIFIDGQHVGGFDDLSALDMDGRLDSMLEHA